MSAWLSSTAPRSQKSGSPRQQEKFCLIPERLPRPRELPWPRWPSSLPLMLASRTQSPSPSVRNFLTFMITCKDSLLKLGYAGEISLSNPSLLAAQEGWRISPFPFKVVFFFKSLWAYTYGNEFLKHQIIRNILIVWFGSLALIPFWDSKWKSHFVFIPEEPIKCQSYHLLPY